MMPVVRKERREYASDVLVWRIDKPLCRHCIRLFRSKNHLPEDECSWLLEPVVELTDAQSKYFLLDNYEGLYYPQHPLRTARAMRSMSKAELACKSGVEYDAIRRIEQYHMRDIAPIVAARLTRALDGKPLKENPVLRRRLSLAMAQDECGIPADLVEMLEQYPSRDTAAETIRILCRNLRCSPESLGYRESGRWRYSRV